MTIRVIQATAASGACNLDWIPLNLHTETFRLRWQFVRSGNGHFEGVIQGTLDNVLDPLVSASPITLTTLTTAAAQNASSAVVDAPLAAIRLAIVSASGNNPTTFRVLQAGT